MAESASDAYDRGREVGDTARQLAEHAEHLAKINGSMAEVATEMRRIREKDLRPIYQELARLADQRDADQATASAMATALRLAEEARARALEGELRQRSGRWQPIIQAGGLVGLILGIMALASYIVGQ